MKLINQEIFDAVWKHAQLKDKCIKGSACLYRRYNKDGTCSKCFVGAIIPDELYASKFESRPASDVLVELEMVFPSDKEKLLFVNALQRVHDSVRPENWNVELIALADKYRLVVPV